MVAQEKPGSKRATLQTIADRLKVSRTTISNAYSRPDQLNPALRQKIFDVAKELGYAGPDAAARSLRRGHSGSLGLIFTETLSYAVTDPVSLFFLRGLAEASESSGINLLLIPTPADHDVGVASVLNAVVDGFVVYSVAEDDARLQAALERRLPTVIVDQPKREQAAFVEIADRAGARAAAEHLLAFGHRRFAVVSFPLSEDGYEGPADAERQAAATFPISRARLEGYADAIQAAGLRWEDVPVQETALNTRESGEAAAAILLDRTPRPTAILAFSDLLASGVLRAAAARGLRVPDALSVTGFDDIPEAALTRPPLTTVRQPLLEKGLVAGRLMLEGWPEDDPPAILLPTELVVRASSGPASRVIGEWVIGADRDTTRERPSITALSGREIEMIEFSAYLAAQHVTREAVREALPDAPVRQDTATLRRYARSVAVRQRISMTLRRLADLVEPMPEPARAAVAGCQ